MWVPQRKNMQNCPHTHSSSYGLLFIRGTLRLSITVLNRLSSCRYINIYGCDTQYGGAHGTYNGLNGGQPYVELGEGNVKIETDYGGFPVNECWSPKPQPVLSAAFFLLFVLISGFVIMSLFVGAVCGGMCTSALHRSRAPISRDKKDKKNSPIYFSLGSILSVPYACS